MWKAIAFALALSLGLIVSPGANDSKEFPLTLVTVAAADTFPCSEPIIVVIAKPPVEAAAKKRVKVKLQKEKSKKKHAAAPTKGKGKHKSNLSDDHKSNPSKGAPTKNPTLSGPLHLTSPPICG